MQPPPPEVPPFFGLSGPPGAHPEQASTSPGAVVWFKVYAGLMSAVYLAVFALGIVMMVAPVASKSAADPGLIAGGLIYAVMGLIFSVPFIVSLFVQPRSWVWVFNLVLICLGLLSCACWPFAIPLLVAWFSPNVKQHFRA